MSKVDELVRLTGWRGRSYVSPAWDIVEHTLGVSLPADYKELLSVFPPGTFFAPLVAWGDVVVQAPHHMDGVPDYLLQFEQELAALRSWRAEHPTDVPHPVFPEPSGMLPWGRSSYECLLWVRNSPAPDEWTVAVSNGGIWRYAENLLVVEEFDCGAVDFLIGLVNGEIRSQVLDPTGFMERVAGLPKPEVQHREVPAFEPLPEDQWRSFAFRKSPTIRKISLRKRQDDRDR